MVVLRDTDSVEELAGKIKNAKKVMVVGNGGIALELAYVLIKFSFCDLAYIFRELIKSWL